MKNEALEGQPTPALTETETQTRQHAPSAAVCHRSMTASLEWYPKAQYQGRTIYFCTEFCLEAFLADPDRFHAAHSRVKK